MEQPNDSREELYLATHEASGATALVRKHAAEEGGAPRKDWRTFLGSWASRGYSVMSLAPERVLVEHRFVSPRPSESSRCSQSSLAGTALSAGTGSPPPRVLADVFARTRVHDGALVLGAALFTALLAQVAIAVPGSPVPITGQTLAVVLTAAALGPVRGVAGQLAYVLLGAVGLPFYSKGASGWAQVLGPTGGYLVGFIPAAVLMGLAARQGFDRVAWKAIPLFLAGQLVILAIGVPWLCVAAPLDLATALHKGFLPFLPGGLLKATIAGLWMPLAWRLIRSRESGG